MLISEAVNKVSLDIRVSSLRQYRLNLGSIRRQILSVGVVTHLVSFLGE